MERVAIVTDFHESSREAARNGSREELLRTAREGVRQRLKEPRTG